MGLGLHGGGVSAARFFVKQGARVIVTDLKTKKQLQASLEKLKGLPIEYILGKHREQDFAEADLIIQNPGVPNSNPYLQLARDNNIEIENEASIFFLFSPAPIIGITGTKGKSTVTSLVGEIIKHKYPQTVVAGNIRTLAMLDVLPRIKRITPVVLELSSWQLEGLDKHQVSPRFAVITNVLDDHLNRYSTFQEYRQAKSIIFKYQKKDDLVVLNYDNPATKKFGARAKSRLVWFSMKKFPDQAMNGAFIDEDSINYRNNGRDIMIMPISEIQIPGDHNIQNILAAVALTLGYRVDRQAIRKAVRRFKGIPDRLETIAEIKGVKYINDTTATAPVATQAALQALGNQSIILIAGGQDKSLDYESLGRLIDKRIKHLILLPGTASKKIRSAVSNVKITAVMNMEKAVSEAAKSSRPDDVVLMSPAAASFNLFANEFDRAEHFIKAVNNLKKHAGQ